MRPRWGRMGSVMKRTIGIIAYVAVCLTLLVLMLRAEAQGWTTTFFLLFVAVSSPGASLWTWRHMPQELKDAQWDE